MTSFCHFTFSSGFVMTSHGQQFSANNDKTYSNETEDLWERARLSQNLLGFTQGGNYSRGIGHVLHLSKSKATSCHNHLTSPEAAKSIKNAIQCSTCLFVYSFPPGPVQVLVGEIPLKASVFSEQLVFSNNKFGFGQRTLSNHHSQPKKMGMIWTNQELCLKRKRYTLSPSFTIQWSCGKPKAMS